MHTLSLEQEPANYLLSTVSVWATFTLIGLTFTVFGSTIPFLFSDFQITLAQAGLLVTFMATGRMVSVVGSGVLADSFGRKPLLILGASLLTLGLMGIGTITIFPLALLFAAFAGVGHGMVDTSGSAVISDLNNDNLSKALNMTHMFFGVGCLLGPLLAGTVLSLGYHWRIIYYIKAAIGLSIICFISFQTFPAKTVNHQSLQRFSGLLSIGLLALGIVIFIYSGVGHSLNTWISSYMRDIAHVPVFLATGTLAIYNLGITLGRLVTSFASKKLDDTILILIMSILSLASISLALFSTSGAVIILCLGFTGFFFGGLFPTVIAIAGRLYPERRGTITGLLVMAASLGSMTIPASTGFLAHSWGLTVSLRLSIILIFVLVLTALVLQNQVQANTKA